MVNGLLPGLTKVKMLTRTGIFIVHLMIRIVEKSWERRIRETWESCLTLICIHVCSWKGGSKLNYCKNVNCSDILLQMEFFVPRDESQIYINDTGIGKNKDFRIWSNLVVFRVSFWQVKEYKIQKDTTTRQWYVWQDIIWILSARYYSAGHSKIRELIRIHEKHTA